MTKVYFKGFIRRNKKGSISDKKNLESIISTYKIYPESGNWLNVVKDELDSIYKRCDGGIVEVRFGIWKEDSK